MSTTITPNMSLPVPVVGVEPGPAWASDINVCLTTLDSHNHAPGYGVQINPNGLNINADLPFGNNNATLLRSTRFSSQGAAFSAAADKGCLYVVGNELYYNDGAGNQVPITASGSVNAGAGSITGLPSGTASVVYSSSTFVFNSATNTRATIDAGTYVMRNLTASSFGLTLQAPTLSSNYTLVLPPLPAQTNLVTIDTSGNMTAGANADNSTLQFSANTLSVKAKGIAAAQIADNTITATQIANNTITAAQIANNTITATQIAANTITNTEIANNTIGYSQLVAANFNQVSPLSSTTYANGNQLASLALNTNSRPVILGIYFTGSSSINITGGPAYLDVKHNGSTIGTLPIPNNGQQPSLMCIDVAPGTNSVTYSLVANCPGNTITTSSNIAFYAYELK